MSKVAFITGAGGYIGGEVAYTLAKSGIQVAVCDIKETSVDKTVKRITQEGGIARGYVADVSVSESVDATVEEVVNDFGRLDIMVHVAGGSSRIAGPEAKFVSLVEQEDYVIDRVIRVNLFGAIYASRAAARQMIKQGDGGKIVNFASIAGINGARCSAEYAASKGGVIAMTKSLAKELGQYKINVNAVAPGVVARPGEGAENHDYVYHTNELHERCLASDVADLTEFLVSEKSRFITGQVYVIDGGRSLALKGTD